MLELLVAGLLTAVGQGALAFEAPTISAHDCGAPVETQDGWSLDCAVTNRGPVAVARLIGETLLKDPERTVPWAQAEFDMQVPGGIEPGETRRLAIPHPGLEGLPDDAEGRSLVVGLDGLTLDGTSIRSINARRDFMQRLDAEGRPVPQERVRPSMADRQNAAPYRSTTPADPDVVAEALKNALGGAAAAPAPTANPGPPMTAAEQDAFRVAVQQCWNVDLGTEAARVTLSVEFDMDEQGRIAGDVRKISATGGSDGAIEAAFQSARRAILRCQRDGYILPTNKYEQWRTMEMTFDPKGLRLR